MPQWPSDNHQLSSEASSEGGARVLKRRMAEIAFEENKTKGHWHWKLKCRGHDFRARMVWFAWSLAGALFLGLITFGLAISGGPNLSMIFGIVLVLFCYWSLANYLNHIRIYMASDHLRISSFPIPWSDQWQIQTNQIVSFQVANDRVASGHVSVFEITIAKIQNRIWDIMIIYQVDGMLRSRRLALGTTQPAEVEFVCNRLQQTLEQIRATDS